MENKTDSHRCRGGDHADFSVKALKEAWIVRRANRSSRPPRQLIIVAATVIRTELFGFAIR
jgi:hypothetical protein